MGSRGKYRSRLQIIADILSIAKNGSRKTRIMFQANLSYKLVSRYLDVVLEADMVCLNDSSEYVITPKGKLFLDKFRDYSKQAKHIVSDRMVLENMCLVSKRDDKRLGVLPMGSVLQEVSE